jgi:hypothetical protein
MSARELLDSLTASGVRLWAEGGKLKLDAPRGVVTPELKDRLAAHKPELLAALTADACPTSRFSTPEAEAALQGAGGIVDAIIARCEAEATAAPPAHARTPRRVAKAASANGLCPGCSRTATLQFRRPRKWWCARCGLWLSEVIQ